MDKYDDLKIGIRAMGDIFDPIRVDLDVSAAVPGLPLSFDSDATITMGMAYDMYLSFGVSFIDDKLDFYIDTARDNELILEAYADLNDDASLRASLGFLDFKVSNLLKNGHKELSAALTVDLKDPNKDKSGRLDDGRLSLVNELRGVKFRDVVDTQFGPCASQPCACGLVRRLDPVPALPDGFPLFAGFRRHQPDHRRQAKRLWWYA